MANHEALGITRVVHIPLARHAITFNWRHLSRLAQANLASDALQRFSP